MSSLKDLRSSATSCVCEAQKSIVWAETSTTRIDSYFTGLGFTKSDAEANLYQIVVEGKLLIIVLYVDDLILTGDVVDTLMQGRSCKGV